MLVTLSLLSLSLLAVLVVLVAVGVAAFAAGYVVGGRRARAVHIDGAPLHPELPAPEPARLAFAESAAEATPEWQREMSDIGARMRSSGVRLVLFAHGSFVGDDPLAIAHVVGEALPALPGLGRALRGFTRTQISRVVGDLSNFPRSYVDAFARATGLEAVDFVWSGENHHAARIQGAVRLARALALHGGGSLRAGDRVLLIGHSHGGQVFAVLSQLLAQANGYEELLAAAVARGEDLGTLEDHLAVVRRLAIDVVTFGTPPRYGWARGAGFRILHVVNHRGAKPRASSLLGVLHTTHGDYVHQMGGHGSDFPAPTAVERKVNARLDRVLGKGRSVRVWLRHVARGFRVSPDGRTVLVDYGDAAGLVPNFWSTGLGHAAYTRRDAMLFHARLVASELYPPAAAATLPGPPASGTRPGTRPPGTRPGTGPATPPGEGPAGGPFATARATSLRALSRLVR